MKSLIWAAAAESGTLGAYGERPSQGEGAFLITLDYMKNVWLKGEQQT